MTISIWTFAVLLLPLYFGWALFDPATVQELEDHLARKSSAAHYGIWSHRVRNGLGMAVGLALFAVSLNHDLNRVARAAPPPAVATSRPLPQGNAGESRPLLEQIEGATLQKQIERQGAKSGGFELPPAGGP